MRAVRLVQFLPAGRAGKLTVLAAVLYK